MIPLLLQAQLSYLFWTERPLFLHQFNGVVLFYLFIYLSTLIFLCFCE